jgi:hypothetical protein
MPETTEKSSASHSSRAIPLESDRRRGWLRLLPSRRWRQQHFSRQENLSRLKTLAWVAPLTFLIWVYARQEQVVKESNITFPIEVKSNDPNRVVTLVYPADKNLVAELEGPRSQLEDVKRKLWPQGGVASVQIDVDTTRLGEYQISALPQLQSNPIFNGITIDGCQPVSLGVKIDRIVTRAVPVEAPPGLLSVQSVRFDPPNVEIRAPASVLKQAEQNHQLAIYANLSGLPILKQPGQHELDASLTSPLQGEEYVTLTPTIVHTILQVRQADETLTISSMPIWAAGPSDLWGRYKVVFTSPLQPFLTNVTVIGPHDQIDLLKKQGATSKCKAYINVTSEDLPIGQVHSRRVRFDLPDDIHVAPASAGVQVDFKLVDATAGE